MSILIRGGTVVNHDHSRRADVLIEGETIAAVGAAIEAPAGVETIDAGGAISYSQIIRIDINAASQQPLLIYPNPARTTLNVNLPAQTQTQTLIEIYSSAGALVKTQNTANALLTLDITALPAGIYTIRVKQNGTTSTSEFVKF